MRGVAESPRTAAPPAGISVELELLEAGHCLHPGFIAVRGGGLRPVPFPAMVGLVRHPTKGVILFDTGYAPRVAAATRRLPYAAYRWLTPMRLSEEETVLRQLATRGLGPADVRHIVLSHFHADHVGGLLDFPGAELIFSEAAYAGVRGRSGLPALRRAFLPSLVPDDLPARASALRPEMLTALPGWCGIEAHAWDLLGDGSLWGVPLPGHAVGQMGVLLRTADGVVFLVADAVWSSRTVEEGAMPHLLSRLITPDVAAHVATILWLREIRRARPDVRMIPSHCPAAIAAYQARHA
jgi:glyoxylase-like metal-dependent hydrolase (beta-lactamase superfamily II)